ncbi:alkaline phosphatase family protein [Candidatus Nanosalina sp. VS9-1]|uniref:alkaline phosphatase family protein n=1 Tax=Candidatus Nanosalina sp. VS9-1 TaxID=3388566 RepID=UPI0039DF9EF7
MKTIVIALDGLDYELVKEFELENIIQEETGEINNYEGINKIKTSELFASFITGKTWEEHGVTGLAKWSNHRIQKFEDLVEGIWFFDKFRELRQAVFETVGLFNASQRKYTKEDLEAETVFEEIENSRAMFVPSYNPSMTWIIRAGTAPLKFGFTSEDVVEYWDSREYEHRKRELFSELENEFVPARDLLMCHFHRPDMHHHMYGDKNLGNFDKAKLKELYKETDDLAGKIKKKALEKGYERIIFMSDHGLPLAKGHNKNAFYSSNKPLFPDKTPHITDFHDAFVKESATNK